MKDLQVILEQAMCKNAERMQSPKMRRLIGISHIKMKGRHGGFSVAKSPINIGVRVTKQQDTKEPA